MPHPVVPPRCRPLLAALTLLLAACLGLVAPQARAGETQWRVYDHADRPWRGAIICPQTAPRTGGYVCVSVDCRAPAPVAFRLTASVKLFPRQDRSRDEPANRQPGVFEIDGRRVARMRFTEIRRGGRALDATEYAAEFDRRRDAELLRALRAGRAGAFVIGRGDLARRVAFSLDGAGEAIERAVAICPVARYGGMLAGAPETRRDRAGAIDTRRARARTQPRDRPQPGDLIDGIRDGCGALGGEIVLGDGFATPRDVDGNGAEDLLLDYGAVSCSTAGRPFCSEAGCVAELWMDENNDLKRVLSEPLAELALPGDGVVLLRRAEAACGAPGPPCVTRLTLRNGLIWQNDLLQRLD